MQISLCKPFSIQNFEQKNGNFNKNKLILKKKKMSHSQIDFQFAINCQCGNSERSVEASEHYGENPPPKERFQPLSAEMPLYPPEREDLEAKIRGIAPGTWRQLRAKLKKFEEWCRDKEEPLKSLALSWLETQKFEKGHLAPSKHNLALSSLKFRYGNRIEAKLLPPAPPKIHQKLTREQVKSYLDRFQPNLELSCHQRL